jgi:Cu-Zn family superoxide dismutase
MSMNTRQILRTHWLLCAGLCIIAVACGGAVEEQAEEVVDQAERTMDDMEVAQAATVYVAHAELTSPDDSLAGGTVTFSQTEGQVVVTAALEGVLPPGPHGLHVHDVGDCSAADYSSAGGHFNPMDAPHACPPDRNRHAGDLGNIVINDDGTGRLELTTDLLTVTEGPLSVVGRAVILHAGEDDCTTQPTGAAGDRMACGVIALVVGDEPTDEPGEDAGDQG